MSPIGKTEDEGLRSKFKFPRVAMKFCSNQRIKSDLKGNELVVALDISQITAQEKCTDLDPRYSFVCVGFYMLIPEYCIACWKLHPFVNGTDSKLNSFLVNWRKVKVKVASAVVVLQIFCIETKIEANTYN